MAPIRKQKHSILKGNRVDYEATRRTLCWPTEPRRKPVAAAPCPPPTGGRTWFRKGPTDLKWSVVPAPRPEGGLPRPHVQPEPPRKRKRDLDDNADGDNEGPGLHYPVPGEWSQRPDVERRPAAVEAGQLLEAARAQQRVFADAVCNVTWKLVSGRYLVEGLSVVGTHSGLRFSREDGAVAAARVAARVSDSLRGACIYGERVAGSAKRRCLQTYAAAATGPTRFLRRIGLIRPARSRAGVTRRSRPALSGAIELRGGDTQQDSSSPAGFSRPLPEQRQREDNGDRFQLSDADYLWAAANLPASQPAVAVKQAAGMQPPFVHEGLWSIAAKRRLERQRKLCSDPRARGGVVLEPKRRRTEITSSPVGQRALALLAPGGSPTARTLRFAPRGASSEAFRATRRQQPGPEHHDPSSAAAQPPTTKGRGQGNEVDLPSGDDPSAPKSLGQKHTTGVSEAASVPRARADPEHAGGPAGGLPSGEAAANALPLASASASAVQAGAGVAEHIHDEMVAAAVNAGGVNGGEAPHASYHDGGGAEAPQSLDESIGSLRIDVAAGPEVAAAEPSADTSKSSLVVAELPAATRRSSRIQAKAKQEREARQKKEKAVAAAVDDFHKAQSDFEKLSVPTSENPALPQVNRDAIRRLINQMDTASGRDTELATSLTNTVLNRHAFGTCLPRKGDSASGWLNDEIILSYLEHIVAYGKGDTPDNPRPKQPRDDVPMYSVFNTQFWSKLCHQGPSSVARWPTRIGLKGDRLLKAEVVFIPVNLGVHWTLMVLYPRRRRAVFYDSMDAGRGHTQERYVRDFLEFHLGDKYVADDWTFQVGNSPQQNNSSDCGVFAITTARMLTLGWDPIRSYSHRDIPQQRQRILLELMNCGLHGDFDPPDALAGPLSEMKNAKATKHRLEEELESESK